MEQQQIQKQELQKILQEENAKKVFYPKSTQVGPDEPKIFNQTKKDFLSRKFADESPYYERCMFDGIGRKPYAAVENSTTLQMARDRFEKQLLKERLRELENEEGQQKHAMSLPSELGREQESDDGVLEM